MAEQRNKSYAALYGQLHNDPAGGGNAYEASLSADNVSMHANTSQQHLDPELQQTPSANASPKPPNSRPRPAEFGNRPMSQPVMPAETAVRTRFQASGKDAPYQREKQARVSRKTSPKHTNPTGTRHLRASGGSPASQKYLYSLDPMSRKPSDSFYNVRPKPRPSSATDADFRTNPTSPKRSLSSNVNLKDLPPPLQLTNPPPVDLAASELDTMDTSKELQPNSELVKQPESLAISQDQLSDEVKGIHAGLVMVEAKCISVVNALVKEMKDNPSKSQKVLDHLQALISLHRTLLHEHHDFLLASQHPSAGPALRDLAAKYSMPGRMWKHGIHSFLELLRHLLPASRDYMLAFIYLSYQMIALLYETVPSFEDTWIECLGDLGRYRMAIEEDDQRDRDIWTGVSRYWYIKAADRNPNVGRLYHHLAILARNQPTQQLSMYCRALTARIPFASAKESIITLLEPTLARPEAGGAQTQSIEIWFIKCHALLFQQLSPARFHMVAECYLVLLNNHIGRITGRFREQGASVVLSNIAGLLHYGSPVSAMWRIFRARLGSPEPDTKDTKSLSDAMKEEVEQMFDRSSRIGQAWRLTFLVFAVMLNRPGDANTLPAVHIMLAFLICFISCQSVEYECLEYFSDDSLPWSELAEYLNALAKNFALSSGGIGGAVGPKIEADRFPVPEKDDRAQPLPEDLLLRGETWSEGYFPSGHFQGITAEEDERMIELPSTSRLRMERVLWLGIKLSRLCPQGSKVQRWLRYDSTTKTFSVSGDRIDFLVSGRFASTHQHATPSRDNPTYPQATTSPPSKKDRDTDVQMAGTEEVV